MSQNSYKVTELRQIGNAVQWMVELVERGLAGGTVVITLGREERTLDQNDKCHPMIRDIARHLNHPILGKNEDQWRHFLIGCMQGQLMVQSLDNSHIVVVPKKSTRKMSVPEMSEFIEYLYSVGDDYNVSWSEPSLQAFNTYREAQA
jgi:hypothetical protein